MMMSFTRLSGAQEFKGNLSLRSFAPCPNGVYLLGILAKSCCVSGGNGEMFNAIMQLQCPFLPHPDKACSQCLVHSGTLINTSWLRVYNHGWALENLRAGQSFGMESLCQERSSSNNVATFCNFHLLPVPGGNYYAHLYLLVSLQQFPLQSRSCLIPPYICGLLVMFFFLSRLHQRWK